MVQKGTSSFSIAVIRSSTVSGLESSVAAAPRRTPVVISLHLEISSVPTSSLSVCAIARTAATWTPSGSWGSSSPANRSNLDFPSRSARRRTESALSAGASARSSILARTRSVRDFPTGLSGFGARSRSRSAALRSSGEDASANASRRRIARPRVRSSPEPCRIPWASPSRLAARHQSEFGLPRLETRSKSRRIAAGSPAAPTSAPIWRKNSTLCFDADSENSDTASSSSSSGRSADALSAASCTQGSSMSRNSNWRLARRAAGESSQPSVQSSWKRTAGWASSVIASSSSTRPGAWSNLASANRIPFSRIPGSGSLRACRMSEGARPPRPSRVHRACSRVSAPGLAWNISLSRSTASRLWRSNSIRCA